MNQLDSFKLEVESNFLEWKNSRHCSEAIRLNRNIGNDYFDTSNPHFFTGNLTSEIVLVHLNPKRNKDFWNQACIEHNFEAYWDNYREFGRKSYGVDSERTHKSVFDHKQVRFLKPFGCLPFIEGDKYHNLEVVIDKKLQLELIPYGSPNFNYSEIGLNNIEPFIERTLDVIVSKQRKYIIFCGKIFAEIFLKPDFAEKYGLSYSKFDFKLKKKDGNMTRDDFHLINIKLKYKDSDFIAAIAPQFAKQGCPIERYGEKIKELYGEF